jgi:hypothetical protein
MVVIAFERALRKSRFRPFARVLSQVKHSGPLSLLNGGCYRNDFSMRKEEGKTEGEKAPLAPQAGKLAGRQSQQKVNHWWSLITPPDRRLLHPLLFLPEFLLRLQGRDLLAFRRQPEVLAWGLRRVLGAIRDRRFRTTF